MIYTNLLDKLDEFLLEMTFKRKDIIFKIQNEIIPVNIHLIKLLKFDDKVNFNKHLKDIENWFFGIQEYKLKSNGKRFTQKKYFDLFFQEPFTNKNDVRAITDIVKRRLRDYSNLTILRNDQDVLNIIYKIHKLTSNMVSQNKLNNFKFDIWDKVIS